MRPATLVLILFMIIVALAAAIIFLTMPATAYEQDFQYYDHGYVPHYVRFHIIAQSFANVTISARLDDDRSLQFPEWMMVLFGVRSRNDFVKVAPEITNCTTNQDGYCDLVLEQTTRYNVTFSRESSVTTLSMYPYESDYRVWIT